MTVSAARLAQVFVEVADTRDDDSDLSAFLRLVTARAAEVVEADAAGVLLADPDGQLRFVAGSDEATAMLELFQMQHHEGPCLECFHFGKPVTNTNLADAADRWPRFAPLAVAAGFRAVYALPMQRDHTDIVGAMSLFQKSAVRMQPDDIQIVQALTDVAVIRVLQQRTIHGAKVLADQLQQALTSRIVIEQAKGVIAQMHHVSVEEAFDVVRAFARRHRRPITSVAQDVVANPDILS